MVLSAPRMPSQRLPLSSTAPGTAGPHRRATVSICCSAALAAPVSVGQAPRFGRALEASPPFLPARPRRRLADDGSSLRTVTRYDAPISGTQPRPTGRCDTARGRLCPGRECYTAAAPRTRPMIVSRRRFAAPWRPTRATPRLRRRRAPRADSSGPGRTRREGSNESSIADACDDVGVAAAPNVVPRRNSLAQPSGTRPRSGNRGR